MKVHAGLDVSLERTGICVLDSTGRVLWRGVANTHPEIIAGALGRSRLYRLWFLRHLTAPTRPWAGCPAGRV